MARLRFLILILLCSPFPIFSQISPTGIPSNSAVIPVPLGFINPLAPAGPLLHMEIPITSIPMRHGNPIVAKMVFDGGWGAFVGRSNYGSINYSTGTLACPSGWNANNSTGFTYSNFTFTDPNNTVHYINIPALNYNGTCENSAGQYFSNTAAPTSGGGYSTDGSGLSATASLVVNYGDIQVQVQVTSIDGTVVSSTSSYQGDTNGNSTLYSRAESGGQFSAASEPITTGGAGCANSGVQGEPPPPPEPGYIYVPASNGSQETYTLNCQTYNYSFQTIGLSGQRNLISSVVLPNGTQYGFSYDSGTTGNHMLGLTGVTFPDGGSESFGYTSTCASYYCLASATFGGGTWQFQETYSSSTQQYTATVTAPPRYDAPSQSYINDKSIYTSLPANTTSSPFLQSVQYYAGSSTLLKTLSLFLCANY